MIYTEHEYLAHHGVDKQKWGHRNGPPYPLSDGSHSASEKKAGWRKSLNSTGNNSSKSDTSSVKSSKSEKSSDSKNTRIKKISSEETNKSESARKKKTLSTKKKVLIAAGITAASVALATYGAYRIHDRRSDTYTKKHVDGFIREGESFYTLSYDPNRTQNTDMFFAAHDKQDRTQYRALFNGKIKSPIYDENGNNIGTGEFYKWQIKNTATSNIAYASEDSGAKSFRKLFKNDDFRDFVTNPERMESAFDATRYRFKGYREAKKALDAIRKGDVSDKNLNTVYRMFNYVIPYTGSNVDANDTAAKEAAQKLAKDVAVQRAKLFTDLKNLGYGALLDTNDSLYGGFKANAPLIVFDMDSIEKTDVTRLTTKDKVFSDLAYAGYEILEKLYG